jgi:hypothetical protein
MKISPKENWKKGDIFFLRFSRNTVTIGRCTNVTQRGCEYELLYSNYFHTLRLFDFDSPKFRQNEIIRLEDGKKTCFDWIFNP